MFIELLEPLKFINHDTGRHINEAPPFIYTKYISNLQKYIYIILEIELV